MKETYSPLWFCLILQNMKKASTCRSDAGVETILRTRNRSNLSTGTVLHSSGSPLQAQETSKICSGISHNKRGMATVWNVSLIGDPEWTTRTARSCSMDFVSVEPGHRLHSSVSISVGQNISQKNFSKCYFSTEKIPLFTGLRPECQHSLTEPFETPIRKSHLISCCVPQE